MRKKGFTLIELLIVVAIIGILAALAIPNMLTAIQKSKQKGTMDEMKAIGTAIESYMTDWYIAPGSSGQISGIAQYLEPFHIKKLPRQDKWGGDYLYTKGGTGNDLYTIQSTGKNRANDGTDSQCTTTNFFYDPPTSLGDFDKDIFYANGTFTCAPRVQ